MTPKNLQIFSPKKFSEFIGQNQARTIAEILVKAAKIENRRLPNVIVDGEYGLGKTTLAKVMLNELGIPVTIYDSAALNKEIPPLSGTIIIDEIHNLEPQICDSLNILLDRDDFTIVGCTTNPGALPMAFKSRFRSIHLVRYTEAELSQILDTSCLQRGLSIAPTILKRIAERSRGNPRDCLTFLQFIFELMVSKHSKKLTANLVDEAFGLLEITRIRYGDEHISLYRRDLDYLNAIPKDRPVGISYIASKIGIDAETIETEIEPYLLQVGLIDRTNKGRTRVGY